MHNVIRILVVVMALAGAACKPRVDSTDSKLVGDWSMPRGHVDDAGFIDSKTGYDITTLKADFTFSQTAHPTQAPPARVLSGTWHVRSDELVLKFTWAHPTMQDMVGQELRLVISDLKPGKVSLANAQHQQQKFVWTRVK